MKFDIVRAWKDEAYRQALSAEEQNMLPTNPVGELELTEAEMQTISGGQSNQHVDQTKIESFAMICEINIFSIDLLHLSASLSNALSPKTTVCLNAH